jgi:hypothetical protein
MANKKPEATVRAHLELDETGLDPLARLLITTGRLYQSITAQTIGSLSDAEATALVAWQAAIRDLGAGFVIRPMTREQAEGGVTRIGREVVVDDSDPENVQLRNADEATTEEETTA